jgi:hypothetical protein
MSDQEQSPSVLTPMHALERLLAAASGTPTYPHVIGPYERSATDDAQLIRTALEEWQNYRDIIGVLISDH